MIATYLSESDTKLNSCTFHTCVNDKGMPFLKPGEVKLAKIRYRPKLQINNFHCQKLPIKTL